MLKPAVMYKDILEKKFSEVIYDDDYMMYVGYGHDYELPKIESSANRRQYAILDEGEVVGWFSYYVDATIKGVSRFGWYSFDKGNLTVVKDIYEELEELAKKYHRIEWCVVCGNHAEHGYDRFCKSHNGSKHIYRDATIDNQGNIHDSAVYEIITDVRL